MDMRKMVGLSLDNGSVFQVWFGQIVVVVNLGGFSWEATIESAIQKRTIPRRTPNALEKPVIKEERKTRMRECSCI